MAIIPVWALMLSGSLILLLAGGTVILSLTVKRLKRQVEERTLSEKQLMQSTAHFWYMADAIQDGITIIEEGKVTYVNDSACEIFGYPRKELLLLNGLDVAAPEEKERLKDLREEIRKSGIPITECKFWIIRKDGSRRYIHNRYAVHCEDDKTTLYVISTDLTEHQQSSNTLRESEEKYRSLFELSPESIVVVDLDSVIIDCNAAAARTADIPKEELIGQPFTALNFFEPEMLPGHLKTFKQLTEIESIPPLELQITNRANRSYRLEAYIAPLKRQGKLLAFQVIARDITRRRQSEAALRESEARYRGIIESVPLGMHLYQVDPDGRLIFTGANPAADRIFRVNHEQFIGKTIETAFPSLAETEIPAQYSLVATTGESWCTTQIKYENEQIVEASEVHAFGVSPGWMAVTFIDFTERKQAEEALEVERNLLRTLIDNLPELIYVKDLESRFVLSNAAIAQLMMGEKSPDALIGKTDFDFYPHELASKYYNDEREVIQSGKPKTDMEELAISAAGDHRWFLTTKVPLKDGHGKVVGLVGMGLDITERLQAQEEFRQYAARLKTLREIDQVILVAKSAKAIAQAALRRIPELMPLCNRASVTLFDMEKDELVILAVHTTIETELGAARCLPLEKETSFVRALTRDQILLVDRVTDTTQMYQVLESEGIYSLLHVPLYIEHELIGSLNLGSTSPNAFPPESLEVAQEIANQLAIAIRQARLLEQAQRQAEELERRVAERTTDLEKAYKNVQELAKIKDEFVDNVSHELRTPITNLKLYQELLAARPKNRDKYMAVIQRETERLEHIIEDLLMLSRLDRGKTRLVARRFDLNRLIKEYVSDRASMADNRQLTLKKQCDPELPLVVADRGLIGQVLSILLTNALNYTPEGGTIIVCSEMVESDAKKWVGFRVSDTGPGIPPDDQVYVFDRFFRGKAGRESGTPGTGLGLAIVKEIIQKHQGEVEVTSEGIAGKGTTFSVWLPIIKV